MSVNFCVFCGAKDGNDPAFRDAAYEVGMRFAKTGYGLVYGAGGVGLMGAVSQGALDNGGFVHGIIPEDMMAKEWARPDLPKLEVVDDIQKRKLRMYEESVAFVTLPGGLGTGDEFFESATWSQLGYHGRPKESIIVNVNGFYEGYSTQLNAMVAKELLSPEDRARITIVKDTDELMTKLAELK